MSRGGDNTICCHRMTIQPAGPGCMSYTFLHVVVEESFSNVFQVSFFRVMC
ncbi:hypothetical protein AAZX31_13G265600 [Glycine max]